MELDDVKVQDGIFKMMNGDPDLAAILVAPLVGVNYLDHGILDAKCGRHENYPGRYVVSVLVVADDADAHSGERLRPMRENPQFQWKTKQDIAPFIDAYSFNFLVPEEFHADLEAMAAGHWTEVSDRYWDILEASAEGHDEVKNHLADLRKKAKSGELDDEAREQQDATST